MVKHFLEKTSVTLLYNLKTICFLVHSWSFSIHSLGTKPWWGCLISVQSLVCGHWNG